MRVLARTSAGAEISLARLGLGGGVGTSPSESFPVCSIRTFEVSERIDMRECRFADCS